MVPNRRPIRSAPGFAALLVVAAAALPRLGLAQQWVDTKAFGPFVCRAEFPLAGWEGLMGELSQLQGELVRELGIPPVQEQIEVYLFRDKRSYSRYLKRNFPQVPYRRALYLKSGGPGKVLAYWSPEIATDLRHECTHALLHAVLPVVPLWLDEGLAEYFEVPFQKRAFDNPHLGTLRWNFRLGMTTSLESLEKKGDLSEMRQAEYRFAWAWVHFMLHGPREVHDELVRFLAAIQAHTPPGVLSQRLQWRLPGTQRHFAAHFKSWKR